MKKWRNHTRRVGRSFRARWFELVCGVLVLILVTRVNIDFVQSPHSDVIAVPTAEPARSQAARAEMISHLDFRPGIRLELNDARPLRFNVAPPVAESTAEQAVPAKSSKVEEPASTPLELVEKSIPIVVPNAPKRLYPRTLFLRQPDYAKKLDVSRDTLARNLAECHAFVEQYARDCYPRRAAMGIPVSIQLGVALFTAEAADAGEPDFRVLPTSVVQSLKQTPHHNYRDWAAAAAAQVDGLTTEELVRIIEALDLFLFDSMA